MAVDGKLIFDSGIDESGFNRDANSLSAAASHALGDIGADIIRQISSAVAEIPKQMVAIGSAYEASMSQVAATMGITAGTEAYEQLAQAAKDAGNSTKFSASEASSALNFLALSGMSASQSIEALPTILNTAAAGGIELGYAADLITDSMSALGLEMSDLATFSDQLAVTAQKSNTSVSQLGEAILTVGGTAKTLSGGITEMNMALGILADNGIKGAEGGTALRNIILSLSAPTNTAAEALESLGLSASLAFDESGTMRELPDIIGDLNEALSELSDQERTAVLSDIFNKVDLKAVNALLGTSAERFDELSEYIDSAEGSAAQMAETMNNNLQGDMTIMQSALEGLGIAAYEKFQLPMRDAVQGVTASIGDLTESLTNGELSDSFDNISEAASQMVSSINEALSNDIIPAVVKGLSTIIDHGNEIIAMIGGIGAAVAVIKIVPVIASVVAAIQTANLNLAMLTMQAGAAAVSETALAGGLTLTELAVGTLTGKISLLTAAKGALKMINDQLTVSLVASKIALAGIAGVAIAAALALKNYWDNADFSIKEDAFVKKTREETEALKEQQQAFEDLKKSQEEKVEADMASANHVKRLWEELQNYVDENGNVISSNERASEIIGLLNNNYDMNIGYIDGQIQGYQELAASMDNYIENLRLESRIRNGQDTYDEAVRSYDDLVKKREDLAALEKAAYEQAAYYREKGSTDQEMEASARRSEISKEIAELDKMIADRESEMEEYESLFAEKSKLNISGSADSAVEDAKGESEGLVDAQVDVLQQLKDGWEQAEHDFAIGTIKTESELYAKKKELWQEYGDESEKDHWKYYEDIKKYDKNYAEDQIKSYEDQIQAQANALREKKELNDNYTDDMYYDELQALISNLDKESDLYQKYNYEILKGRKGLTDEMIAEARKQAEEEKKQALESKKAQVEAAASAAREIKAEYSQQLSAIQSEQESYKNKLRNMAKLYTADITTDSDGNKSGTFTLENIDAQIKAVEDYDNKIKSLEKRGMGKGLANYLQGLSQEDSEYMMKSLGKMTDDQLKSYSDKYDKLTNTINERAESRYAPQIEEVNNGFVEKLREITEQLPEEMRELGLESIENFVLGFTGDGSTFIETIGKQFDDMLANLKENAENTTADNIENSSGNNSGLDTVNETASDLTVKSDNTKPAVPEKSFDEGVSDNVNGNDDVSEAVENAFESVPDSAYQYGEQSAEMFMEGFRQALSDLYEQFAAEQMSVSASITAGQRSQDNYRGSAFSNDKESTEKIVLENHEDITVKIDKDVLGKTTRTSTREFERRTGT